MRPAARLRVGGRDIDTLFGSDQVIVSIEVHDEAGLKADALEIEIDDREGFSPPALGTEIEVWLGYEPSPVYRGRFKVAGWRASGPRRSLQISAIAAEMTSEIRSPKSRAHLNTTVGAIVEQIASAHGLTPSVDAGLKNTSVEYLHQQTESDLAFLTRLAGRMGATFKIARNKAIFTAKGSTKLPSGKDKAVRLIRPGDVSTWSQTYQSRGDYKSVKRQWHDHAAGERRTETAGAGEPVHRDRRVYRTREEAAAAAHAHLGDLSRGKGQLEIEAPGLPDLFAEGVVQLSGFASYVDGRYLIKQVVSRLDSRGYQTIIQAESAT